MVAGRSLGMPSKKNYWELPPCPDPEKYILVRTREGCFWRRKRGTVKEAHLNRVFAQNVTNTKLASPAAKRVVLKLSSLLYDLNPGRLNARLSGLFIKAINQKGYPDLSFLKHFEFSTPGLDKLFFEQITVIRTDYDVTISFPVNEYSVARHNKLVKDFYFEAILLSGDTTIDHGLHADSTVSQLYSFEDKHKYECRLSIELPSNAVPWILMLKVTCQEEDSPSANARHYGMKVVEVG